MGEIGGSVVRVLHVGPGGGPGGIASAIANLVDAVGVHERDLDVASLDSYLPAARAASIVPALLAATHLVRTRRTWDVVHVHLSERGSFVREGLLLGLARLCQLPTVASLHGADFPGFLARYPRLVRTVLGWCTALVALGDRQRRLLADFGCGVPVYVIPNTAPSRRGRNATGARNRPPVVLFAGVVGERKGIDRLLDAWPEVRAARADAELWVCGPAQPGPDLMAAGALRHQALGIRDLGAVPRAEVIRIMEHDASVLCLPARREVLPMVLLEAVATGLQVVTTDVGEIGGLADLEGVSVLDPDLTRDDLVAALLAAISNPLEADAAHRRCQRLDERMGPRAVAAAHARLYTEVLQRQVVSR